MRWLSAILVMLCFQSKAQQSIGPYYEGVYAVDTIGELSYTSPGNCSTDVGLTLTPLLPFVSGMQLELVMTSVPDSVTVNGNPVSVGNSFLISPTSTYFEYFFAVPGTLEFMLVASGTPTIAGEEMPCVLLVDQTLAACNNGMSFQWYSPQPLCYVSPSVGIEIADQIETKISVINRELSIITHNEGQISIFSIDGKAIMTQQINSGFTSIDISDVTSGNYIVQFNGQKSSISKKILLH